MYSQRITIVVLVYSQYYTHYMLPENLLRLFINCMLKRKLIVFEDLLKRSEALE